MKFRSFSCFVLALVSASVVANGLSLDREAFTFTQYDLTVTVEPDQHRLSVRGHVTLRNDSQSPRKIAVLQISSSLAWRSIKSGEKPLQFVAQPVTSDIDHTGGLSEAIVTVPEAIAPEGMIDLTVAYEGVILQDATRLTRIGTPDDVAKSTDWDQIDEKFTGVRGAGNVAWYPIATEAANLSEDSVFEVLGRWKAREVDTAMHFKISMSRDSAEVEPELLINQPSCLVFREQISRSQSVSTDCTYRPLGTVVPAFVIADYSGVVRPEIEVHFLRGHDAAAASFAEATGKAVPLITEWFGPPREKAKTADLPFADAAPFESGSLLLTPLVNADAKLAGLAAAHQLTHAAFLSYRPWIEEGLAHFAQALYLEQESGRHAALDYIGLHRSVLISIEKQSIGTNREDAAGSSLINTMSDELYRSKAMCVWWMLRDMLGDQALNKALAAYKPEQDKEASYMPRLIAAQTQRDLEWFFDDWVYRDRGLPDFKVESVFPRKTMANSYMVTISVENLGSAGAEVPVIVKFAGGEVMKRLEVRTKSKGAIRVEVPSAPVEVVVNDGSVPESDMSNNLFKVSAAP